MWVGATLSCSSGAMTRTNSSKPTLASPFASTWRRGQHEQVLLVCVSLCHSVLPCLSENLRWTHGPPRHGLCPGRCKMQTAAAAS